MHLAFTFMYWEHCWLCIRICISESRSQTALKMLFSFFRSLFSQFSTFSLSFVSWNALFMKSILFLKSLKYLRGFFLYLSIVLLISLIFISRLSSSRCLPFPCSLMTYKVPHERNHSAPHLNTDHPATDNSRPRATNNELQAYNNGSANLRSLYACSTNHCFTHLPFSLYIHWGTIGVFDRLGYVCIF